MPRTKLAPKKQRQQFVAKVTALLLDLGAEPSDFDFCLHTKAGLLRIHPTANLTIGLGTVFARFDDPQAVRQFLDCNPYSGKWNHHFFDGWNVELAVIELDYQLRQVL
jgi:hypothetical protein